MSEITIVEWIYIGAVGGAAGVSVWLLNFLYNYSKDLIDKKRVSNWLYDQTKGENALRWRTTRTISSYNNLTEDRTRYICSIHKKICLSTGSEPDLWGIIELTRDSKNTTLLT